MLGFATVDVSSRDDSLTVWLTSVGTDIPVAHTNAIRFDLTDDTAMMAKQTTAGQEALMAAFAEHAAKPGKADLMEPVLPPVPSPVDQAAQETGAPEQLTLAVANQVRGTWAAWLAVERERVKRWMYMPGGSKGATPAPLPVEFVEQNVLQPVRPWER